MPTPFPELDPDSGTLVMVDYYAVGEVADMFHMSHTTVRRRCKDGEWPNFEPLPGTFYLSPQHVAEVVALLTHPARPPVLADDNDPPPPRLGIPVADKDLEGVR